MKLEFLEDYKDPYLKTDQGKGVFLAGVLFGYMANCQVMKAMISKSTNLQAA